MKAEGPAYVQTAIWRAKGRQECLIEQEDLRDQEKDTAESDKRLPSALFLTVTSIRGLYML